MAANRFWNRKEITQLEQSVQQQINQLEQTAEFKNDLKHFYLSSVTDLQQKLNAKKQVLLILIPYPCLKAFQKISQKLIDELEKRLKSTVLISAKRSIESKWVKKHRSQQRPFSRTLTSVYDATLEDLLTPLNILGKRTRVQVDGNKFYRIFLDENDKAKVTTRLEIVQAAYKLLTTRQIEFEFRKDETFYTSKKAKKPSTKKQQ